MSLRRSSQSLGERSAWRQCANPRQTLPRFQVPNPEKVNAAGLSRCLVRRRCQSTTWCGSPAIRPQLCGRYCLNSKLPDASNVMARGWYHWRNVRYASTQPDLSVMSRFFIAAIVSVFLCGPLLAQQQSFEAFVADLWTDAQAKGISRATFDLALKNVTPDQRVIAATRRQPEYGKPVGDYVNAIVSNRRIADAQLKAREWTKVFDDVEKKYQVERWVLLALWGMESDFGTEKDRWDVFRSLATLAYTKYRHPYFRNELIVAMRIMQDSHFPREKMVSSWAGAMGQTQFMPTNFVDFAIDFSGDGRADIWRNVPDVLASTANYLHKWKWNSHLPWGFEVVVPNGFDYMKSRASFAEWRKLGLHRADGKPFPENGEGILFFPSGAVGPAFLVTENFAVLKEYNNSDA